MLKHILTGGIDLPELHNKVLRLEENAGSDFLNSHERFNVIEERIRDYDDLIASRALAEDVETLRLKLDRRDREFHSRTMVLSSDIAALRATVADLAAKVEALTAAKLAEVKARKAPKKDAAK